MKCSLPLFNAAEDKIHTKRLTAWQSKYILATICLVDKTFESIGIQVFPMVSIWYVRQSFGGVGVCLVCRAII